MLTLFRFHFAALLVLGSTSHNFYSAPVFSRWLMLYGSSYNLVMMLFVTENCMITE